MKPIRPRPIFILSFLTASNRAISNNWHRSAFSTHFHQYPVPGYNSRRQDKKSRTIRVSVWWDFENCNVPLNTNVFRVAQSITNAVRANGIRGPIQITAFGDVTQISRCNQEALSSTGICLTHVPSGGKNSADRSLLVDLMYWVYQNPPPAHLFLISGDRDFAGILHRLRMNNYNILLSSPDSAPSVLCSAATIMWPWSSLLKGENLNGRLFNNPPDGLYNSWYGQFKAPLEDAFSVADQSSCLIDKESSDLVSDSKIRPIPKAVVKHIRQILSSHPKGITISQLRRELANSSLAIDRELYGYKKLTPFLLAMPHILEVIPGSDRQLIVKGVNAKYIDKSVPTTCAEPTNGRSSSEDVSKNSTEFPVPKPKAKATSVNLPESKTEKEQNESNACAKNVAQLRKEETLAPSVHGSIQEIREQDMKVKLSEITLPPVDNMPEPRKEEKLKESPVKGYIEEIQEHDKKVKLPEDTSPIFNSKDVSEKDANQILVDSDYGFFRRIWMKWFGPFRTKKNSPNDDDTLIRKGNIEKKPLSAHGPTEFSSAALISPSSHEALISGKKSNFGEGKGETIDQFEHRPKQLEVFSEDSFWKEVELFINTSKGASIFSLSRTREHLVQNLRNQGPPIVRSLPEHDLLHLVELLISEKKWIQECKPKIFPFKITRRAGKDPQSSPNGLRNIFSDKLQSSTESHKRSCSSKSRRVILADCRKLVDYIVKEHPEGFNIGSFRKLFREQHGYALDINKLGYEKLTNLLQIMPGVGIQSGFIVPAGCLKISEPQNVDLPPIQESEVRRPCKSLSKSSPSKDDDSDDSSWDELGPVSKSGAEKEETDTKQHSYYEPVDEDIFTDSEEETSGSENENKANTKDEASSLMQILDSWYSSNKEGDKAETGTGNKIKIQASKPTRKPKATYSFVKEETVDSKDKLVDDFKSTVSRLAS